MFQRCWACPLLSSLVNSFQNTAQNGQPKRHHYRPSQGQSYVPVITQWRHMKRSDNETKWIDAASNLKYATTKPATGQVMTLFREQLRSPASRGISTLLLQCAAEQQDIFGNRLSPVPSHQHQLLFRHCFREVACCFGKSQCSWAGSNAKL